MISEKELSLVGGRVHTPNGLLEIGLTTITETHQFFVGLTLLDFNRIIAILSTGSVTNHHAFIRVNVDSVPGIQSAGSAAAAVVAAVGTRKLR
eukprot:m.199039 g.199039  ORF g.199039 m.199039 type:complete len:93 (+) comp53801_c0_seq1:2041-2319(+)